MKPIKATGRTNARRGVVNHGRTSVMRRFLTINVQICLRKRSIVACRPAAGIWSRVQRSPPQPGAQANYLDRYRTDQVNSTQGQACFVLVPVRC